MKKLISFFACALFLGGMALTSCEGPAGPQGEAGPAGENGVATCGECHDMSTDMYAKLVQYEVSGHYVNGNFERNSGSCAICHTHEGFIDNLATGEGTSDAALGNPTPVNCRTCHNIHANYDATDWALTTTDPITYFNDVESADLGMGNLCASCHQSRSFDVPVLGGADIEIGSKRYGPHHGPQSDVMNGNSFVEIAGSSNYPSSNPHLNVENACVGCHMASAFGRQAGGHTFNMGYDYHGSTELNLAGCTECHQSEDFGDEAHDFIAEIGTLHAELHVILEGKGYIDADGYVITGTYSAEEAAIILNYRTILEDKSKGVHNPFYVEAILENSIEAATAL